MTTASKTEFHADAVLFDIAPGYLFFFFWWPSALTDSISAVEAAWGKVALDIGQDPAHVIVTTHGKRAVDNLSLFKPSIKAHEMDDEVTNFILYYADPCNRHGPGSRQNSVSNSPLDSPFCSGYATPALSASSSTPSSRRSSMVQSRRPSFASRLFSILSMSGVPESSRDHDLIMKGETAQEKLQRHQFEAWQLEAKSVDRSVRILPVVKRVMDSIPAGRYAVATSGAKTYAYGCMTRVGITPPPVTITGNDKRLKTAPDPFLLAAKCLGFPADRCVVFEDSPSGIRAGIASGATVITVCTSHERSKIENCTVHIEMDGDRLKFTLDL
ncbi:HAD-like domain-containing protein [Mycena maculata]|uniref:HAD-like domain-containing protein n=1 Tax=Mycena maculata TaxID=230809 RepID=A0AAD7HJY0_9AGAR|nr:HAD-like domain-containing protein [Mycena maculata]